MRKLKSILKDVARIARLDVLVMRRGQRELERSLAEEHARRMQETTGTVKRVRRGGDMTRVSEAFNHLDPPPREYLMRRSYNPNDDMIPGAIVRLWRCNRCFYDFTGGLRNCPSCHHDEVRVYAVDVPIIKTDGSHWM